MTKLFILRLLLCLLSSLLLVSVWSRPWTRTLGWTSATWTTRGTQSIFTPFFSVAHPLSRISVHFLFSYHTLLLYFFLILFSLFTLFLLNFFVGKSFNDFQCLLIIDCHDPQRYRQWIFIHILQDSRNLNLILEIYQNASHKSTCFLINIDPNILDDPIQVESFLDIFIGE